MTNLGLVALFLLVVRLLLGHFGVGMEGWCQGLGVGLASGNFTVCELENGPFIVD